MNMTPFYLMMCLKNGSFVLLILQGLMVNMFVTKPKNLMPHSCVRNVYLLEKVNVFSSYLSSFFFFHFLRSIDLHHVAAFLNLFAIKVLIKCVIDIITNHDLARKACGAVH